MSLVISSVFTYDTDAGTYIQAVEAADGQALEGATRQAINDFVIGCKQDNIWSAIKASCILAGARTLSGALVPLVGAAPTNNNFVSGDYNRKTGLVGDGSTKSLGSNYTSTTTSIHMSVYASTGQTANGRSLLGTSISSSFCRLHRHTDASFRPNLPGGIIAVASAGGFTGFGGANQNGSTSVSARVNGATIAQSSSGGSAINANYQVFANNQDGTPATFSNARLAFYSIGESLDLALLDARVTALINAFATAIP